MPCRDARDDSSYLYQQVLEREAMLCAVLRTLNKEQYDMLMRLIDWPTAGVTQRQLTNWWTEHKKSDEERRKRDEVARKREELRQQALAKLTKAEREALDLK